MRHVMIFNFVIFQRAHIVRLNHQHNVSETLQQKLQVLFPWDPSRECINHHSLLSKWRRRATAGGEELGFKQYRLQEVQPSLLVVDSDINSNEYLGALPGCLSMNCVHTWGRPLEAVLFVVLVCASVHVYLWCVHCCVPVRPSALLWACAFVGVGMSNMQSKRKNKWPKLIGTINQSVVGAPGRGWTSCWGYTCKPVNTQGSLNDLWPAGPHLFQARKQVFALLLNR